MHVLCIHDILMSRLPTSSSYIEWFHLYTSLFSLYHILFFLLLSFAHMVFCTTIKKAKEKEISHEHKHKVLSYILVFLTYVCLRLR